MKYLKKFEGYLLLEAFVLNKMYQQQNIIPEIQVMAKNMIDNYFNKATMIPADMQRNRDKVEFWLAKNIKASVLKQLTDTLNGLYDQQTKDYYAYYKGMANDYKQKIAYIKGVKADSISDSSLGFVNSSIEDFTGIILLPAIFDYLLSPTRNINEPINLVTSTIQDMHRASEEWHDNLKASGKVYQEEGKVIKRFPNGYYWIDLQKRSSKEEAEAMGHCGRTRGDTLLSLRRKSEGGFIEPFVTIAIDYQREGDTKSKYDKVHQIKGKGNKKPIEKYHPYIVELLLDVDLDIQTVANSEYSPKDDFHLSDLQDGAKIRQFMQLKPDMFKGYAFYLSLYVRGIVTEDEALKSAKYEWVTKYLKLENGKVLQVCDISQFLFYEEFFQYKCQRYFNAVMDKRDTMSERLLDRAYNFFVEEINKVIHHKQPDVNLYREGDKLILDITANPYIATNGFNDYHLNHILEDFSQQSDDKLSNFTFEYFKKVLKAEI